MRREVRKWSYANRDLGREADVRGGRCGVRRVNRARRLRDGAGGPCARSNHPKLNRRADADRHAHAADANANRCASANADLHAHAANADCCAHAVSADSHRRAH